MFTAIIQACHGIKSYLKRKSRFSYPSHHHRCAQAQHDMKNPPSRGHPYHTTATPAFVFGFALACKAFPNVPLSHPKKTSQQKPRVGAITGRQAV